MSTSRLGDLLVSKALITREQLRVAEEHRTKNRSRLTSSLLQLGHVNEGVLTTFLSQQYGVTAISLDGIRVDPAVAKLIPKNLCEKHCFIPLSTETNVLSVAISDPTNVSAIDDIRFLCNMEVSIFLATETAIQRLIEKVYENVAPPMSGKNKGNTQVTSSINFNESLKNSVEEAEQDDRTQILDLPQEKAQQNLESETGNERPVIKFINTLFVEAARRKCSDIHIEPYEQHVRVRFRMDGSLHEVMRVPATMRSALVARVKVMAQLDISQKRLPQDGRIDVKIENRKVDIRVSILPTIFGEKIVMRLLDAHSQNPSVKNIGFEEDQYKLFTDAIRQPYGMILVTGPTGSGKSTTLYAGLNELNGSDVNISTVEDPVEYNMAGINQTQVKDSIGMSFSMALRSLLRQDPDIVMVGEIRDAETAEIAIKASLTGHLVLSTLHTNDAPSTISRMKNMGVESFLITASVVLVQAQRLLRMNCTKCLVPDERVTRQMLLDAEMPENWIDTFTPMKGKGCDECSGTGFKGRKPIFEVMPVTEGIRAAIIRGENSDGLRVVALKEGMVSLRHHGLIRLYRGETSFEEVLNNSRADGGHST